MEAIIVAGISAAGSIITIFIQTYHARKKDNIESKLDELKTQFKDDIKSLKNDINSETLSRCKYDLISIMSKIQNGYTPTHEEKRILIETKELYNSRGGNSYVNDMFNDLKKEGKL